MARGSKSQRGSLTTVSLLGRGRKVGPVVEWTQSVNEPRQQGRTQPETRDTMAVMSIGRVEVFVSEIFFARSFIINGGSTSHPMTGA